MPRKRKEARDTTWVFVEPTLPPMMSPEEALASIEADRQRELARRREPPRGRRPKGCTINTCHYPGAYHPVPMLRLRGHWLTQMGFPIGCKLEVCVEDGKLVVMRPEVKS